MRAFAHLDGVARRCVYDNLAAAVRKIVGARRELTGRFLALVSHYLFEPDFARIGEGHDKGGVESRGKAIRLAHLTPIPRGDSLDAISRQLLGDLDAAFAARHGAGRSSSEQWEEERGQLLPVPATSFEVRKPIPVEISSRAMVRIEGAWYSVPSRWARLNATAYLKWTMSASPWPRARVHIIRRARFEPRQSLATVNIFPSYRASLTPCARSRRSYRGIRCAVERIVGAVMWDPRRTGSGA